MSKYNITLIPGDGVGPEVVLAARRCVEALDLEIGWDIVEAGGSAIASFGTPLPEAVLKSIKKNRIALKGPITTPVGSGFRSVNVELRRRLDLYACVRPCKSFKGVRSRYEDIDLVVIRENTEDLYAGIGFEKNSKECKEAIRAIETLSKKSIRPDSAISVKPISLEGSRRITRFAFEYALKNNRRKVTAVHKANIMKCTDGLFLEAAREVAKAYEGRVEFEERIVDNMCMQLVQKPQDYDCIVTTNLYGDIISDLAAGLVGGLGMAPGANIGDGIAIFEPTHGSAPKYKGKNKVNPAAMILSASMMLRYLGETALAEILGDSLASVIEEGRFVTYDLKDNRNDLTAVGTSQMADAVIEHIKSKI